jgi:hypothetical protein
MTGPAARRGADHHPRRARLTLTMSSRYSASHARADLGNPGPGVQMARIYVAHGAADPQQPTAQIGYSRAGHRSAPITQCDPPRADRYADLSNMNSY